MSGNAAPMNILWIGVDQMRQDTAGCYGNTICKTPNIDALAAAGVVFDRAYTTSPLCTPARASMFTGKYAFHHGMGTNCDMYHALAAELSNPDQLLHTRLQNIGYQCGFAGKWHVGTNLGPADYGYDAMHLPGYGDLKQTEEFQAYLAEKGLSYGPVHNPIYGNDHGKTLLGGQWNGPLESSPDYYLVEYTNDQIRKYADSGKPFFMNCQFWAPHPPYLPAGPFIGQHDRSLIQPWGNFHDSLADKPESLRRFRPSFYRNLPKDWEGWRELVGLYYDYTAMTDALVGRLIDNLKQLGIYEQTIIVLTSDHGDMNGSHGGLFDKGFLYEEAMRIPLIVSAPALFEAGRRSEQLVTNMDVFPTLLDALGCPEPQLDGRSFMPILTDTRFSDESGRANLYLEFHGLRYLYSQRALITRDSLKYIYTPGDQDELYDLANDPLELHNVLSNPGYADKARRVQEELIRAAHETGDPIRDYISKSFGQWDRVSVQVDASNASYDNGAVVQKT